MSPVVSMAAKSRISMAARRPSSSRSVATRLARPIASANRWPSSSPSTARTRGRSKCASALVGSSAQPTFSRRRNSRNAARRAPSSGRDDPGLPIVERGRRHAGKAAACHFGKPSALIPRVPHQHGLGLIVGGVAGQDQVDALAARGFRQQPVARLARGGWQAARRLWSGPAKCAMRDAALGAEAGHGSRFRRRARPQIVIDRHRQQPGGGCGAVEMVFEEKEEGGRVAAAGYGCNGAVGKVDLGKIRKVRPGKVRPGIERQHAASALSCLIRSLSALERSG